MGSPIYIQIHNKIKQEIEANRWAVGDRIPSERDLAVQFGVSRMTLRQAIQTLVEEGHGKLAAAGFILVALILQIIAVAIEKMSEKKHSKE